MKNSISRLMILGLVLTSLRAFALGSDLSQNFDAVRKAGADVTSLVARLKKYNVIFVPGFMTNNPLQYKAFAKPFIYSGGNFDDQMTWLKSQGIENHRVVLNTESTPALNGAVIAADVAKSTKPVLLITHSKGGLDTLHMLMDNKALREKIAGWLPFQTPFRGSPIADEVVGNGLFRAVCFPIIEKMGGSHDAIKALTTSSAERYLENNAAEIESLVRQVPTMVFLTTKANVKGFDTSFEWTRNWMESLGIPNDGLIPETSAHFPGADFVKFVGLDHGQIVAQHGRLNFARTELTQQLLEVYFQTNGAL